MCSQLKRTITAGGHCLPERNLCCLLSRKLGHGMAPAPCQSCEQRNHAKILLNDDYRSLASKSQYTDRADQAWWHADCKWHSRVPTIIQGGLWLNSRLCQRVKRQKERFTEVPKVWDVHFGQASCSSFREAAPISDSAGWKSSYRLAMSAFEPHRGCYKTITLSIYRHVLCKAQEAP